MAKENGGVIGIINTPSTTTASGVWALQDQYEAKRNGNWPLTPFVSPYSARFNSDSSDYLSRTPSSSANTNTYTFSTWVKKSENSSQVAGYQSLLSATDGSSNSINIGFGNGAFTASGDYFEITYTNSSYAVQWSVRSNALYRDVSAWYHVVVAVDTTQATASNRVKLYVNGEAIATTATSSPAQNTGYIINTNVAHNIGRYVRDANSFLDGYLAETYMIGGSQLTPSSFGASNASGVWYPIPYSGSYGTNGFYLKFGNASSLGTDSSPNGNNWTVNNLTSVDQSTDSPLNNFCTINTLTCNDTASLTSADGNLTITGGDDMGATIGITKGKWYWESKRSNTGTVAHWGIGFTQSWNSSTQIVTGNGSGYFFRNDFSGGLSVSNSGSNGFTNISTSSTGSSVANGDIIGVALDLDSATKAVTFYQNGSSVASATFSYDGTSSTCFPFIRNNSGAQSQWNFGSPPYSANSYTDGNGYGNFSYAVPSGYYALCTANLNTYG